MTFLIIIALLVVGSIIYNYLPKEKKTPIYMINQTNLYELIKQQNIDEQQKFVSRNYSNALILDKNNNLHIFFSKYKQKTDGLFVYGYTQFNQNQIIQSEIIIDNYSVSTTNRASQVAGMAIGGLALGSAGMIIGGLSGSKSKNETIKSVDLKITVENLDRPVYKINFLSNQNIYTNQVYKNGYAKESSEVKAAFNHVEKWHGIFDVLIKQQNRRLNEEGETIVH